MKDMLSDFAKYVKTIWKNKPDTTSPISADNLNHIESGIEANSDAIKAIADAVVSDIVNDPNKIASMAAAYALQQKLGTGNLPDGMSDVVSGLSTLNSNLGNLIKFYYTSDGKQTGSEHNMYCTSGTIPATGIYLLFGNFVFPNTSIETNWSLICSNSNFLIAPKVRRIANSPRQSVTMFAVGELNAGSQVGMYGDGTYGADANYWSVIAIRLK